MGFTEEQCQDALKRYDGNENAATNFLLGQWIMNNNLNVFIIFF